MHSEMTRLADLSTMPSQKRDRAKCHPRGGSLAEIDESEGQGEPQIKPIEIVSTSSETENDFLMTNRVESTLAYLLSPMDRCLLPSKWTSTGFQSDQSDIASIQR
jgi:hypothetical protein